MSSASAATSTTTLTEQRPEAEPLPRKVGELGYVAPPKSPKSPDATQEVPLTPALPARHPADRDPSTTTPSSANTPAPTSPPANNPTSDTTKKSKFTFLGISLFSWFRVIILLLFLAGTSAAWGITIEIFGKNGGSSNPSPTQDQDPQASFDSSSDSSDDGGNPSPYGMNFSSLIIVHVSFTIVVLVELLFLERSIFHARAERYLHKRGMQSGEGGVANMGFAPWNRPSLPTYAATLAEVGVRTGDAEDNLIAIPPPPAYGNTRGSVLLLSGFLRDSLVRNMSRSSHRSSQRSTTGQAQVASPREMEEGRGSRPISYDASEEMNNARRAVQLEEALSKLENGGHTPRP